MLFPYERFLRFLVSRKVDLSSCLDKYGLPGIGQLWEIDTQQRLIDDAPIAVSRYLRETDRTVVDLRAGFLEWADRHEIRELWETQPEFGAIHPPGLETAFHIFINPHMRSAMGLLLLSSTDDPGVMGALQENFGLEIDDEGLALYRKFFWDCSLMGRKAWETFVATLRTKEERNAIAIGLSAPSQNEVRHILGLGAPVDPDTVLHSIMQKSYYRFLDLMEQADPEEVGAMKWAELAKSCAKELSAKALKAGANEEAVPADFGGMFAVKVTKSNHLSLTEIQGEVAPHDSGPKSSEGTE